MRRRIQEEKPVDVVILFGKANSELAVLLAGSVDGIIMTSPHPAARGAGVPAALKAVASRVMMFSGPDDVVKYRNGLFLQNTNA
jgi:ABC-type nitrate/sulfonate/bicarbonate transport system substrate-binding protein